ncbi:MAG: nucleotidyltransferase family protein [Planctomycetes bacterium]|nr:nucleotidyltransferase family protein [Planctomycetota bacterium]
MSLSDIHELPALILVGGLGTRLKSVVRDRPKPMALVAGLPFLEWLVLMLRSQGFSRIIFCTGHKAEMIRNYFGDGSRHGVRLRYSHETSPLGTGGAVRLALEMERARNFIVLNGDSFLRSDFNELASYHLHKKASSTMFLVSMQDRGRYGAVEVDDLGAVQSFSEKIPGSRAGLINAGVYCFDRRVFTALPLHRPCSLEKEILPGLIGKGLHALVSDGQFIDIGTPQSYAGVPNFFKDEDLFLARPAAGIVAQSPQKGK